MKEIEEDTHKWEGSFCSCTEKINIVKMSVLPKPTIYSVQSYQDSNGIFTEVGKNTPEIYM